MKIEVIQDSKKGLIVRLGDRYVEHLTSDEALWCVAVVLVQGFDKPHGWLKTKEEHDAEDKAFKDSIEKRRDKAIEEEK